MKAVKAVPHSRVPVQQLQFIQTGVLCFGACIVFQIFCRSTTAQQVRDMLVAASNPIINESEIQQVVRI
jgi:hypothetical protein